MKKTHKELIILLISLFINSSIAWSQIMLSNGATAGPDIESAVVLCDTDELNFPAFSGSGTPTATSPGIDPEVNSIWVAWTVGSDGPMTFTITPDDPTVNFDFVLFESFDFRQDRGDETIIRKSYATCPGPTGLAIAPNTMSCPESFDTSMDLFQGDVYALLIHTTSDNNAFTLSFGGTSNFEGPKPTIEHTGGDCFGSPKSLVIQNIGGANITSYEWNFGDGASITDTIVSDNYVPIIDYATTGSKTIQLTLETDLGCRVQTTYTLDIEACCSTENSIAVDTTKVIKASCESTPTGEIDVSVANPSNLTYTVDWSHDPTEMAESLTQLGPDIYQFKVENTAGCKDSIAVNLATDNVLAVVPITTFVTDCSNPSAGKIAVQASGGEAPYEYNYGIVQDYVTADTIENLPFGTYNISVRDASGCIVTASTSIDSLQLELVASSPQNASCKDTIDGSIVITEMMGGAAPFTYDFGGGISGGEELLSQIPGKNDGAYIVTVTDDNGCIGTIDVTITEPDAVIALVEGNTFVDCHGSSTGSLLADPSGGTPTYEYLWSTGATTNMIENLLPDIYGVTVTDANGCQYMDDVLISDRDSIIATSLATDLTCNSNVDGTIQIVVEGGEAPYSYSEDGITFQAFPSTNDTLLLENLSEGDYTITIRDNKNCVIDELVSATINSPSAITATDTTTLATCGGGLDGSITITASGGNAPYSFEFFQPTGSIGTNTTGTMMGLGIGDYTVTVTDANGCEAAVQGIEITELTLEDITIAGTTDLTCFNDNTGVVEIAVNDQGAQGPFTYDFFDGNGPVDASALTSLAEGTDYEVEVIDANGCQGTAPLFSIIQPDSIEAFVEPVRLSCFGDTNGASAVTAIGGSGIYEYEWSEGTIGRTVDNLSEGMYSVVVTDDKGCQSETIPFSVTPPPPIAINSITPMAVNCPSDPVGSIDLAITGGVGTYEYSLDNGTTFGDENILSDLTAGDYTIIIRDAEGCIKDTTATINSSVTVDQPFILAEGCYGNIISFPSGEDFITVSQGSVTSWAWTFGEGADMAFADTPGPHDVTYNSLGTPEVNLTVTLDNGCVFTENINGATNDLITMEPCCQDVNEVILTPIVDSTSCSNSADGSILLDIESAADVMSIAWDDTNLTGDNPQNLAVGTYGVMVTNAATCTNSTTATIESPTPITISNIATSAPACGGGNDGIITLSATGGTGDYMYNLGDGFTADNEADALSIGDYTISVQDENNCTTTDSLITLSERVVNINSANITEPNCNGDTNGAIALNHSGISPLLSIIYNGSNVITDLNENGTIVTLEDLPADNYNIEIRDAENCRGFIDTIMLEPDSITINLAGTNISCFGEVDGAFSTSVTGGSPGGYVYDWDSGESMASISNLGEGTYVVTVTDINGCSNTQNGLIVEPNELSVGPPEVQNVFCFGNTDGTITLQGIGGSAPYTYSLEGQSFQIDPTIQNLASGDYTLFVRDSSGCEISTEASIDEPGEFTIIVSEDQTVTLGEEIQLNAFASLPEGVVYTWNTPDSLTCNDCSNPRVKPSRSGIYEVTATNPGGCSDSGTIRVLVDFDRPIYIPNAFSPNDDGFNDRFYIEGGPAVQLIRRLSIFDRYGAMVYDRTNLTAGDVSTGWDGTFNGEVLPIGVYIVRAEVDFIDGEVRTFVEDVTLAKDR